MNGLILNTIPDCEIRLNFEGSLPFYVHFEAKPAIRGDRHNILGQEVAHMLASAQQKWHFKGALKEDRKYRVLLVSVHRLFGYISKMTITGEQMYDIQKYGRDRQRRRLLVQRSVRYDLADARDRVKFTVWVVELLLAYASFYHRGEDLVADIQKLR